MQQQGSSKRRRAMPSLGADGQHSCDSGDEQQQQQQQQQQQIQRQPPPQQQEQQQGGEEAPVVFLGDLYARGMHNLRAGFTPGPLGYGHHPWWVRQGLRMGAVLSARRRLKARWRREEMQRRLV